jgi:hypothetical protein
MTKHNVLKSTNVNRGPEKSDFPCKAARNARAPKKTPDERSPWPNQKVPAALSRLTGALIDGTNRGHGGPNPTARALLLGCY